MSNTYQIYLISDSTGETLDRIFLALKAQFLNIEYKVHSYSFTRTENQILKILLMLLWGICLPKHLIEFLLLESQ